MVDSTTLYCTVHRTITITNINYQNDDDDAVRPPTTTYVTQRLCSRLRQTIT